MLIKKSFDCTATCLQTYKFVSLIFLGVLTGCQSESGLQPLPGQLPVQGQVTLDGESLDAGDVAFISSTLADKTDTDEWFFAYVKNGRFQTHAPPGTYLVRIQKYQYDSTSKTKIPTLPERYDKESTFTAEVTAAGPNKFKYALTSE
ncbi:hypothetical protein M4951_24165 [Blastopirellula sp. J2-11]|uniref:hypothetical protein n=1 Tax=Blastopirellula sp. J2-11 TaxID=2943192 RepID=UPI0021C6FC78|nr:hypothetical protein [Blastopirellula sp. J2-11]UUO06429.1 hypothetical protein M4951_24165 [Blastopirellula sp. J2-11]